MFKKAFLMVEKLRRALLCLEEEDPRSICVPWVGKEMCVGIISALLPFRDSPISSLKILLQKTDIAMAWQLLDCCFRQGGAAETCNSVFV